jgi:hypothetical protein
MSPDAFWLPENPEPIEGFLYADGRTRDSKRTNLWQGASRD